MLVFTALVIAAAATASPVADAPVRPELGPEPGGARARGAQSSPQDLPRPEHMLPAELDEPRALAVRRALDWLASRQDDRDGSLFVGDANEGQRAPVAVTALAALAWMSAGSSPTRGPHQDNVTRAVEYLLACVHQSTDEHPGYIQDREDGLSRTHGHGFATLALAQAYTVSPRTPLGERIAAALVMAVRRIEVSQGAEGGWEYEPSRQLAHEGSVTVALVQALRAAQDAGVQVDSDVVTRAVDYVMRSQVASADHDSSGKLGGFRYGLGDPKVSVELTVAALTTLQAAGKYEDGRIADGFDYVWRKLRARQDEPDDNSSSFPYYERFYLSQALWHHRGASLYADWATPIARDLVASQRESGRWDDVRIISGGRKVVNAYGSAYATSFNVLFLTLPDGFLPIFQR